MSRRETILLIDDDLDLQSTLREFLETEGFEILVASTGCEAFLQLADRRPDLILLDLNLPDVEGHLIASRTASHWDLFDVPIFVISGRSDPKDVWLARVMGARDYLVKPFLMEDLRDRIDRVLGSPV